MPDLRITELPPLEAAAVAATDPLPVADLSANETKRLSILDLLVGGIPLIPDGTIPGAKVDGTIPVASIGTDELIDKCVTAIKLANNSTVVVAAGAPDPNGGIYVGQLHMDTNVDNATWCWNGNSWVPLRAAGSINNIVAGNDDVLELIIVITQDVATIVPRFRVTTGAGQFAAGPSASGGAVTMRGISSPDLPRATNTLVGGVSAPVGGGLRIDDPSQVGANAEAVIDNDIAASPTTFHLATYTDKGIITAGRPVEGSDLPIATANSNGVIQSGTEFTVDINGVLQSANQITPGVGTKVTYNGQGQITGASPLGVDDIPALPASKITSGFIDGALIADDTINRDMLADYSISYIQEATPTVIEPGSIGMYWYQPSTGQLRIFDGNYWAPVGFGRLSAENLRWGGIIDAATGLITGVTALGQTDGLEIGQLLPQPTDQLGGLYVVVGIAGNGINVPDVTGLNFDAGDWVLCINEAEGWERIDTMAGGGGGGATQLNQLTDVTINGPAPGQALIFQANAQWQNVDITAADVGALAPGDDITELVNNAGYITAADIPPGAVVSVNGQSGVVVLTAADVNAATDVQGALADSALQPGNNVSELNNDAGYITAADIPALDYVPTGSWAALPVLP